MDLASLTKKLFQFQDPRQMFKALVQAIMDLPGVRDLQTPDKPGASTKSGSSTGYVTSSASSASESVEQRGYPQLWRKLEGMEDRKKANLINFVKDFHRDYPVESEQIILPEMLETLNFLRYIEVLCDLMRPVRTRGSADSVQKDIVEEIRVFWQDERRVELLKKDPNEALNEFFEDFN